jgi:radical S-adenosyl methionine domain-containing protein 2
VLPVDGENQGSGSKCNASSLYITSDQFKTFVERHRAIPTLVPESNEQMQNSYLLLDERMRFLDCSKGGKIPGRSILEVDVATALSTNDWDPIMFQARNGEYDWTKESDDIEDIGMMVNTK